MENQYSKPTVVHVSIPDINYPTLTIVKYVDNQIGYYTTPVEKIIVGVYSEIIAVFKPKNKNL